MTHMASVMALVLAAAALPSNANAQGRTVGRKGATQLSFNASVSAREATTIVRDSRGFIIGVEEGWAGDYRFRIETGKFMTNNFVLLVGTSIGGNIGGESQTNSDLSGGIRMYLTPSSTVSPYISGGAGLATIRAGGNTFSNGAVYGSGGVDAAVRDNAIVFFEGALDRQFAEGGGQSAVRFNVGLRVLF